MADNSTPIRPQRLRHPSRQEDKIEGPQAIRRRRRPLKGATATHRRLPQPTHRDRRLGRFSILIRHHHHRRPQCRRPSSRSPRPCPPAARLPARLPPVQCRAAAPRQVGLEVRMVATALGAEAMVALGARMPESSQARSLASSYSLLSSFFFSFDSASLARSDLSWPLSGDCGIGSPATRQVLGPCPQLQWTRPSSARLLLLWPRRRPPAPQPWR
ncbi:hypothetical protein VTK73DRAFT_10103 [Phialemonium thermophilum]|uniref:Uncharacterized protein n=1 Tax=Phialemonium thermophilum TaxID=223376 RepID=A0ABR3VYG4_9PEZI